jgi:hypothetical protein
MRTELSEVLNRRFVHSKIRIILILEKIYTFNSLNESKYKKLLWLLNIKVITKLPNSEQSYKEKVKTHKYTNRQNQSTIGKL